MSNFLRTKNQMLYIKALLIPQVTVEPTVGAHKIVVDRSGSMYGDISKIRESIKQVIATESIIGPDVLTTLISFSSHKDCKLHWSNVRAADVAVFDSPYQQQINSIQATCYTGISQGLYAALKDTDPNVTTGITLLTDGYANDPSSYEENKAIEDFIQTVKAKYPKVFVNVIGYRDWCDWVLMGKLANELSGKCVKARSTADVYQAMKDTQALVSGGMRAVCNFKSDKPTDYVVVVNRTTGQVNAAQGELTVAGMSKDHDYAAFQVRVEETEARAVKGYKVFKPEQGPTMAALALAFYNTNNLRICKEILMASGNKTLWEEYATAMTPSVLGDMANALSAWVVANSNEAFTMGKNEKPKYNLHDLAKTINSLPKRSLGIDVDEFYKGYVRRSIKNIPGVRRSDGTLEAPRAELVVKEDARIYVKSMDLNSNDASVQITTSVDVWVKRLEDGKIIKEVEYVDLTNLKDYRSYTILSCGERTKDTLPLQVFTKQAYAALSEFVTKVTEFKPGMTVELKLKQFMLEADDVPSDDQLKAATNSYYDNLMHLKILNGIYNAAAGSAYSAEQVQALNELHVTPSLYFSPPRTVHYVDREKAVQVGEIDSFTRYSVYFGTKDLLTKDDVYSGNEWLKKAKMVVSASGEKVASPKLSGYQAGDQYFDKVLKGTPDYAFMVMKDYFDFTIAGHRLSNDEIKRMIDRAEAELEAAQTRMKQLALEVGCTGTLPKELDRIATKMTAEEFAKSRGIKLSKAQSEGMYYTFPNGLVISIVPKTEWFTTTAGAIAAKQNTYTTNYTMSEDMS
jgi:hypothetical protein